MSINSEKSLNPSLQSGQKFSQVSVMTPSIGLSKLRSSSTRHTDNIFHPSNPNPQKSYLKFKGVREIGYKAYEKMIDPTDVIKFGKKVNYENKTTQL